MLRHIFCAGLTATLLFAPNVLAVSSPATDDTIALSRYIEVSTDVDRQQRNPMQTVVSIAFPPNIRQVGQAINYTIKSTGYSINDLDMTPEETRFMYTLPLPEVHRRFDHVKVINVLKTLVGDAFIPMADPVRRKVAFKPVVSLKGVTQ